MKSIILILPWLLVQLDNTDAIRKPLPMPVEPHSVQSQLRMYVYLSKFAEICQPYFHINRGIVDVELVKLRIDAVSRPEASSEMYDEAVRVEDTIRTLTIKMTGEKAWCATNKFVLTAHGYERIFKEQESK